MGNRVSPVSVATHGGLLIIYCDISNWVESTACHCGEHYGGLQMQCIFHMCLQKERDC